ncbi:MAG: hypothetical protein ACLFTW_02470 [Chitinispirillaceae bacterium]
MIRINLAKSNSKGAFNQKTQKVLIAVVSLVLVVGAATSAFLFFKKDTPQQKVNASAPVDSTAPKPSSHIRTDMIENVVKEVGSDRSVKKLNVPYKDMTVAEKINYEVLFGRNALELVGRSVLSGIKLKTLEVENFKTIYAHGLGSSRELVSEMFTNFKSEQVEVMPQPLSYIKDDPIGYKFVITCKPKFGLGELTDPFQALDHLGFKEALSVHLEDFSRIAKENDVKFRSSPRRISVERTGSYRRVVYRAEGQTTYRDFNQFVLALYNEKVPCAFKKISLAAKSGTTVNVVAEVLFTTKN